MIIDLSTAVGQHLNAALGSYEILDLTRGRWLTHVIFVDTEAGIVRRHKIDEKGVVSIDFEKGGIAVEELRGRFAIVPCSAEGEGDEPCAR